jgi:hypothetical protein
MYKYYYVNKRPSQDKSKTYEVHASGCKHMPPQTNRYFLGYFNSCSEAVKKAKEVFKSAEACAQCCPDQNKFN